MGMAVGGSQGGPVSEPNIVPLIDVLSGADHHLHGDHAEDADGLGHSGSAASSAEPEAADAATTARSSSR